MPSELFSPHKAGAHSPVDADTDVLGLRLSRPCATGSKSLNEGSACLGS